jgi:hypothetical protein
VAENLIPDDGIEALLQDQFLRLQAKPLMESAIEAMAMLPTSAAVTSAAVELIGGLAGVDDDCCEKAMQEYRLGEVWSILWHLVALLLPRCVVCVGGDARRCLCRVTAVVHDDCHPRCDGCRSRCEDHRHWWWCDVTMAVACSFLPRCSTSSTARRRCWSLSSPSWGH